MEVENLKIDLVGSCLSYDFLLDLNGAETEGVVVDKKIRQMFHNDVMFKLRYVSKKLDRSFSRFNYKYMIFLNFRLVNSNINTLSARVQSKDLKISKTFAGDKSGCWRLLYEGVTNALTMNNVDLKFEIEPVHLEKPVTVCSLPSTFAPLYEDTELLDFELQGNDGSVQIHSTALAATSPALHRMLKGKWKETQEKALKVPGTSKATLQHLKDYIYLGVIPETGVENLLLLASCYMMDGLTEKCTTTIISTLQADDATRVLKFALDNNLTKLYSSILECVQNGSLKVSDILCTP